MKNGKKKSRHNVRRIRGGCGPNMGALMPATLSGDELLGTSSGAGTTNNAFNPAGGYYSNMVGGAAYGFGQDAASLADVPSFAGSYSPLSTIDTSRPPDNNSRGGNNFSQGGGGRFSRKGKKSRKWRQRGCSKGGKRSTKSKCGTKSKRSRSRRMRGGSKRSGSKCKRGGMFLV
jgi:hypothetical protein